MTPRDWSAMPSAKASYRRSRSHKFLSAILNLKKRNARVQEFALRLIARSEPNIAVSQVTREL